MADTPKGSAHLTPRQRAYQQAAEGVRHNQGVHPEWCFHRDLERHTAERLAEAIVQDGEQESAGHRRDEWR